VRIAGCFTCGTRFLSTSRRWRKMLVLLLTLGSFISFVAAESATVTAQQPLRLLSAAMHFRNASWEEHLATNCYIGHGATVLDNGKSLGVMALAECQAQCLALPACKAVTFHRYSANSVGCTQLLPVCTYRVDKVR
jgi:hypothetical protein